MFQINKTMFNKSWPVIAAQVESDKEACSAPDAAAATPSPAIAAEAGYVLGIAMGYALIPGAPANISVSPRRKAGNDEKAKRSPGRQPRPGQPVSPRVRKPHD